MAEEVVRKEAGSNPLDQVKVAWHQFTQYVYEVRTETKRVTWPSKQEVYGTTVMVVLTTFLFGFYFYLCDQGFGRSVKLLLDFLRHRG